MRKISFKSMVSLMLISTASVSYASTSTDSEPVPKYLPLNLIENLKIYHHGNYHVGFRYIVSDDSSVDAGNINVDIHPANSIAILGSSIGKSGFSSVALSEGSIGHNSNHSVALSAGKIGNSSANSFAFIGKIDDKSENSVAIGNLSNAKAERSIAIGVGAIVHKNDGIALGTSAVSHHTNAVAIGKGSETDRDNSFSFGSSADTTKNKYLTNIADGEKDQDAVTVAQLNRRGFFSNPTYTTSYFVGNLTFKADESNVVSFGDNQTQLRLVNIADGKNSNDAVNKKQLDDVKSSITNELKKDIGDKVKKIDDTLITLSEIQQTVIQSEQAAADLAAKAADSATKAGSSQQAAEQSAQEAANSAAKATDSATKAGSSQQAAEQSAQEAAGSAAKATDSVTKAGSSQQAAEQSAQEAANSAAKATDSATKAGSSQQAAEQSAQEATNSAAKVTDSVTKAGSSQQAAEQPTKDSETNKQLGDKITIVKKASEERMNKLDAKTDGIYKYAQDMNAKMGEYHVYSEKRFNALESEMRQSVHKLDNKINRVEKRANAGIASVAAMTNIPYSNANRFSVGVGLGQYRDGSAIAVGTQAKVTENVNVRASTSWNNSDGAVFGAGVAIGW
ncbi:YadA-like family protein [Xenorhabdus hominickii]|uniref:Adhesin n=1 Tax=Xenorhabdus hominickii TaxID=351679 RepID=A0A2G0QDW2_XENHO|nr:YadA-like family protein [Xenorhabdus hominickii]PHM57410.1 adhesin [Xenorhabdus hominickii]